MKPVASPSAAEALQRTGYKITRPRAAVAAWMEKKRGVFSVKELRRDLPSLDAVSVYRTVELFQKLDLIHPVLTVHGEQHYEIHGEKHHHHAVCERCETTRCIPACDLPSKKIKGFAQLHHTLVFTGLCLRCA